MASPSIVFTEANAKPSHVFTFAGPEAGGANETMIAPTRLADERLNVPVNDPAGLMTPLESPIHDWLLAPSRAVTPAVALSNRSDHDHITAQQLSSIVVISLLIEVTNAPFEVSLASGSPLCFTTV